MSKPQRNAQYFVVIALRLAAVVPAAKRRVRGANAFCLRFDDCGGTIEQGARLHLI
ncbi:hypothetical protein [Caballeronia grimmiae]|uniref:hypothetical protein n=1 Tax=Caballeronia grimmiae TaxID=1071679 RepID=UPI0038B9D054